MAEFECTPPFYSVLMISVSSGSDSKKLFFCVSGFMPCLISTFSKRF